MVNIFCLIAPSAAGKSTVEKILQDKYGCHKAVSCTTRPPRPNEVDGQDYYYKTDEEFEEMRLKGLFAETTTYRGWHYGVLKSELTDGTVLVIEPKGLEELCETNLDIRVIKIFINVNPIARLKKIIERGDDINEITRRFDADYYLFDGFMKDADIVVDNHDYRHSPDELADIIYNEIETLMEIIYE